MKLLTANFVTCAVKACKASPLAFPLHFRDAELEQAEMEYNPAFLRNILPRIEWEALRATASELGFSTLPEAKPEFATAEEAGEEAAGGDEHDKVLRDLHTLLMETSVKEGKLECGNCGHQYAIREGIANFLLPAHLV